MLNGDKSNPLTYMITCSNKNIKGHFWRIYDFVTRAFDLSNRAQDKILGQFFVSRLYLFDSMFKGIVWIDKPNDLMKEFVFLTMIAMEIGKRQYFSCHNNGW